MTSIEDTKILEKETQDVKSAEETPTIPTTASEKEEGQTEEKSNESVVRQATIEDDMKQLVGSVSSWWSGFSKKSQEQINEVRASIDSQGGLISIAKREAAKFEAQLNEAQKVARQSVSANEGEGVKEAADDQGAESGKGKQKQVEGDDGAEVERLEERTRMKSNQSVSSERRASNDAVSRAIASSATGDAFFDADAFNDGGGGEMKVIDDAILATRQNAQSAMQSMQSFWGKVQSDPRVNKMQASVAKTLQGISLPKQADAEGGEGKEDHSQSPQTKRNLALPDLSKQFQNAFPHLDLKDSQAMAKRYFQISQDAARDWGKEMSTMVTDLVKVVPPEESEEKEKKAVDVKVDGAKSIDAVKQDLSNSSNAASNHTSHLSNTEEEDFDWDREVDTSSSVGLETTTGPPTTSWEDSDDQHLTSQVQTVSEAEEQSAKKNSIAVQGSKASSGTKKEAQNEDDEDSDWE